MADDRERLAFRLQHIIPRSLTPATFNKNGSIQITANPSLPDGPQEVFFQMTWGKIAGKIVYKSALLYS